MNKDLSIVINEEYETGSLDEGLFIFIIHATRIPPHLGLIYQGKVYDINVRGKKIGIPLRGFIDVICSKKIPSLFFRIDATSKKNIEKIINHQIAIFDQVTMNVTCLAPVKGVISELFVQKAVNCGFVFELIPLLFEYKLVTKTLHFGLEKDIVDSNFRFKTYTMHDIQNRVNQLTH